MTARSEEVARLYEEGLKPREVAERCGITVATVWAHIKQAGLCDPEVEDEVIREAQIAACEAHRLDLEREGAVPRPANRVDFLRWSVVNGAAA